MLLKKKTRHLQKLKTVEQMTELFSAVGERLSESVVRQSEVLQHPKVEEYVVETLELVVAEIQLVQRLVKRVERTFRYRSHPVVRHVETCQVQRSETETRRRIREFFTKRFGNENIFRFRCFDH